MIFDFYDEDYDNDIATYCDDEPEDDPVDLGPCCICEGVTNVDNLYSLNFQAPPGTISVWGCFQCNLEPIGAMAAVCDECHEKHKPITADKIKFIMNGADNRIPMKDIGPRLRFEHDPLKHPGEII